MSEPKESLIDYPCDFPLKIFGEAQQGFAQAMAAVVQAHAPDFDAARLTLRASSNARYLCLTCTIRATSREQLDNLYRDLSSHPLVKMVL
ncbi:YbeD family protein [Ferrigenium sp. UT5]|uniref:HP0495 family protein n=1 Tax=Ferrigenium sp. UT5 TaxID=3242105 RepID=UPI00354F657A